MDKFLPRFSKKTNVFLNIVLLLGVNIVLSQAPTAGAIGTDQIICYNTVPESLTNESSGTGNGDITYLWEYNTNLTTPSWLTIPDETGEDYAPGALTVTTQYRRFTISSVDGESDDPTSVVEITVYTDFTAGAIDTTGETICYNGDPSEIGSDTDASGGDGSITYKWQADGEDIPDSNSATFDPPSGLTATTIYTRWAYDETCNTDFEESTGSWIVTVNPDFTAGAIDTTGETICYNGDPSEIGSDTDASGGDGSITYKWQSSELGDFSDAEDIVSNTETYDPPAGLTVTTTYRRLAHDGTCNDSFEESSGIWVVTVTPNNTVEEASSDPTLCINTDLTDITHETTGATGIGTATNLPNGVIASWDADIITISGIPTESGEFNYSIPLTGGCGSVAATGNITVDPASVGGTVSSNQSICTETEPADLTLTGHTGTVLQWQSSTDVDFTSPLDIEETTTTLTGTIIGSLTENTYFRAIVQSGVCDSVESSSVLITVDEESVGGIVSSEQTICYGTQPADLSLTDETGDVVRWESSDDIEFTSPEIIDETATTLTGATIGELTVDTYFRAVVQNGACSEEYSDPVLITVLTQTIWGDEDHPEAWFPCVPNASIDAVIAEDYVSADDITAKSLTVFNDAAVVISSGDTVTLDGDLDVESGSFVTFNNNANLIQSGTTNGNSGAVIIKRDSSSLKRLDYSLWSSPVDNQQLRAFSQVTDSDRFYTYNSNTNKYNSVNPSATTFADAKGYLIRVPNTHPINTPTIWTGSFTGVPNNGDYSYSMEYYGSGQGFNLVGNPYPSPIKALDFINETSNSSNITGTLYFWRKTNNAANNNSYCSWTTLGFIDNGYAQGDFNADEMMIQTGQGFFVEATGAGLDLKFNNSMRDNNHNNLFLKTTNSSTERNRIWLNATNTAGAFSQTLIGYVSEASQGYDAAIDGKYIGDGDIALTSLIETSPYAIQGRALPFEASDIVSLSFKAIAAGNYTIAIDRVDGLFSGNQDIYLRDNLNGGLHDLKSGSYSFASEAGTFASRFAIVYQQALAIETPVFNENQVVIYKNQDKDLVVNTGNIQMQSVKVFDIRGRLLLDMKDVNGNQVIINPGLSNEVLLVKITSEQGNIVTKKVIN